MSVERLFDGWSPRSSDLAAAANSLPENVRRGLIASGTSVRKWDRVPSYENPVGNWQWELLNIGFPNSIQSLQVRLLQLEIIAFRMRDAVGKASPAGST